jgi:hypothetical protein
MGLTSAEGLKLECFKRAAKNIYINSEKNLENLLCSKVMRVLYAIQALSISGACTIRALQIHNARDP